VVWDGVNLKATVQPQRELCGQVWPRPVRPCQLPMFVEMRSYMEGQAHLFLDSHSKYNCKPKFGLGPMRGQWHKLLLSCFNNYNYHPTLAFKLVSRKYFRRLLVGNLFVPLSSLTQGDYVYTYCITYISILKRQSCKRSHISLLFTIISAEVFSILKLTEMSYAQALTGPR
jgi:hypothetical protein